MVVYIYRSLHISRDGEGRHTCVSFVRCGGSGFGYDGRKKER